MIARRPRKAERPDWVAELRQAYTDPLALLRDLAIEPAAVGYDPAAAQMFAFRVPRPYARRMRRGAAEDPLLRQVLPRADERQEAVGFARDPVGDLAAARAPGLLHKYHGRALLLLSGACAINCRYCFRREFPYQRAVGSPQLAAALANLAADPTVSEVILSGGDPLLWHDERLGELIGALAAMPQITRVRIHTRLPLVLPARITPALCAMLATTRLQSVLVLHVNHPDEIDEEVAAASHTLGAAGVTRLNQSVLLRGVNDDNATLVRLSEQLFAAGILPYYLHLLDRVRGAAHFEVTDAVARTLQEHLLSALPGYLVPRFVREIAGAPSKVPFW